MSLGLAIASLPRSVDALLRDTDDPFLIEVVAPIESETVDEAVRLAVVAAQALVDAARDSLVAGAPTDFDTFAEALARALADEAATAALGQMLGSLSTAFSAHTGNTSNPHGVTASQVGLGRVTNTSDVDKTATGPIADALGARALTGRKISASGLVTGGGDLSADLTLEVKKATLIQAQTGADDVTVMTPLLVKGMLSYLLTQPNVLAAYLPTTLPSQTGVPWLNNGIVSIA